MGAETKRAPLLSYGSWTLRGFGLKRMAAGGIVTESVRWALQGRFPVFAHTGAPGAPVWMHLFYAAELILFLGSTVIALDHVLYAVSTQRWRNLNPLGIILTLALWLEVGLAGGRFAGLGR